MEKETLIEVFGKRPTRMKLLKAGLDSIELSPGSCILEAGCAYGEGIAFACEKTGAKGFAVDMENEYIEAAKKKYPHISFETASVYNLGYDDSMFDLVFSQAAFSLLEHKMRAIGEYRRVLKDGGYVIINDFVVKSPVEREVKDDIDFIPCFNSIGTIDEYISLFESSGFKMLLAADKYSEIVSTTLYLSKKYKCMPNEMAGLFARILGSGEGAEQRSRCFFKNANVSYAQMVFQKSG